MILNEVKACLDRLVPPKTQVIAVAISGGADSIFLCLSLVKWASLKGIKIVGLTVDHMLRPESTAEANTVHAWLTQENIEHHILTWHKDSFPSNIQDSARIARYELLLNWCKANGVNCLALGHSLDDQYETVLQRLSHHSGPLGLSSIAMTRQLDDTLLIRPLLPVCRADIIEALQGFEKKWIEDPSNKNTDYTRILIRSRKQEYSRYHLTSARISSFQNTMQNFRQTMEKTCKKFTAKHVQIFSQGYCLVERSALLEESDELICYLISVYLQELSGNKYPPSADKVNHILTKIKDGVAHTSHGCRILCVKNQILICRELAAIPQKTKLNEQNTLKWDNRFEFQSTVHTHSLPSHCCAGMTWGKGKVHPLSNENDIIIQPLGKNWLDFKENEILKSLPSAVKPTLPSIWQKERLLNIPHLDYHVSSDAEFKIKPLFFQRYKKV